MCLNTNVAYLDLVVTSVLTNLDLMGMLASTLDVNFPVTTLSKYNLSLSNHISNDPIYGSFPS